MTIRCPICGSDYVIDMPICPPYDAPPAGRCGDCGYEDYPSAFEFETEEA